MNESLRQRLGADELRLFQRLQQSTSKRYADRKDVLEKQRIAREKAEVLRTLHQGSWKLLADAIKSKADLETLTELQIAWRSPHLPKLLEENYQPIVFRSLWSITEAARALPGEEELRTLSKETLEKFVDWEGAARRKLKENPGSEQAFLGVLYSALATQNGAAAGWIDQPKAKQSLAQAYTLLMIGRKAEPLNDLRLVASLLLKSPARATVKALEDRIGEGLRGEDRVVLGALAAKRCGGSTWRTFREQSRDILGTQPLDGSVVVLVHRLSASDLPVVLTQVEAE